LPGVSSDQQVTCLVANHRQREKRRGGSPRGVKPTAELPGGRNTIRSLDNKYENEGLPVPSPLPSGEVRQLRETGNVNSVDMISRSQRRPRKAKSNAQAARNTGRQREILQSEEQFPAEPLQRFL
jgi:hypothetical protein